MTFDRNSFKNLRLWQDAQAFAEEVCELADGLPNTRSADVVARQLIRAATSIAANIAEGHGRYSFAAYRNHLGIARGSATESRGWIDLIARRRLITSEQGLDLDGKCGRLVAILTLRIRDLDQKLEGTRVRDAAARYDPFAGDVGMFEGSDVRGGAGEEGR